MYTPDHENDPVENGAASPENQTESAPAADPSYNPYLQEKKQPSEAETETGQEAQPESEPDGAKTSSWESGAAQNGTEQTDAEKKCPHCGAPLREGAKFCVSCGRSLQGQSAQNGYPVPGSARNSDPQHTYGAPVPPPQDGNGYRNVPQYTPVDPTVPEKLSVLDYFVMFLVTNIPLVGLVLALFWGFSSTTGINRKNFARTVLIMRVIQYVGILIYVLLIVGIMRSGIGTDFYDSSLFY